MPPRPAPELRRRDFRRPGARRRTGQSMVEVAAGLIVFVTVLFLIFDGAWLLYHHVVAVQAVKKTARQAGTNRFTRDEIEQFFYRSVPVTNIRSAVSTLTITTVALDPTYTSSGDPNGRPSVLIRISHPHRFMAPLPNTVSSNSYTITATARAQISTWPDAPLITY